MSLLSEAKPEVQGGSDSNVRRNKPTSALAWRLFLILFGVLLASVLAELGARLLLRPQYAFSVLPPSWHREFHPAEGVMPGIDGVSTYSTRETGIRGDPYDPDNCNILAIGGSTTQVLYLDDSEAWPYLVQEHLGQTPGGEQIWVGNIGSSGHFSANHVLALRHFVPQFRIDLVIVMPGINDLAITLARPESPLPDPDDPDLAPSLVAATFFISPPSTRPFPRNFAITNGAYHILWRFRHPSIQVEDNAGLVYVSRRELFQNAPVIHELPDLSNALEQYEHNLVTLNREAEAQDIKLILATQPTIWSEDMSDDAKPLLWIPIYGDRSSPSGRYSTELLSPAMDLFNQRTLQVCESHSIECVDLAGSMNGNETLFYDDVHFNEAGSRTVAELLAAYLEQHPPCN